MFFLGSGPGFAWAQEAEGPDGPNPRPVEAQTAPTELPELTPEQEEELKEWMKQWKVRRDEIFDELVVAVGRGDRVATYDLLVELHGGGHGVAGSKYELFRKKAEVERGRLVPLQRNLSLLQGFDVPSAALTEREKKNLNEQIAHLEQRIQSIQKNAESFETKALLYADAAVLEELPVVFEMLGGPKLEPKGDSVETKP